MQELAAEAAEDSAWEEAEQKTAEAEAAFAAAEFRVMLSGEATTDADGR